MSEEILKIPGKLMLSGEYAVTLPGRKALVFAVDRFLSHERSQLVNKQGIKYGLGSSGAYAVLKTKSENSYLSDEEIFLKALYYSRTKQPKNSGADVAASTFGGLLYYQNGSLPKRITFPSEWRLLVGWTGHPAITSKLVEENKLKKSFIERSDQIVSSMAQAIVNRDFQEFQKQIIAAEQNLELLKGVMTNKIDNAIKIAKKMGVAAKISGAGAGDNVISFCRDKKIEEKIKAEWKKAGIISLDLHMYFGNER